MKTKKDKNLEEKIKQREKLDLMFYGLTRGRDLIKKEIEEEMTENKN